MRNRFNSLTAKEWLPFQKSWFRFSGYRQLFRDNIRFFTHTGKTDSLVFYYGKHTEEIRHAGAECDVKVTDDIRDTERGLQFAVIDLLGIIDHSPSQKEYACTKKEVVGMAEAIFPHLQHRRFLAVLCGNPHTGKRAFPFAWDLANEIASLYSVKDEKIACIEEESERNAGETSLFLSPRRKTFYVLYFRKDEMSAGNHTPSGKNFFRNTERQNRHAFRNNLPAWFILKPPPRKKDEILHPAKYPEELVRLFASTFSDPEDLIFDPMAGTGSTLLGALMCRRNACGIELSSLFAGIAHERCLQYLRRQKKRKPAVPGENFSFTLHNADVRSVDMSELPRIDYMITSPPYWDMLNMKGAGYQAGRKAAGLQTNYSDDTHDLGNIPDYGTFLEELIRIYNTIIDRIQPGRFFTIVVKNIKKKKRHYPLAWDLAEGLQHKAILLPEVFWCQDDIPVAPYGFGNTWVSNTFHHYCLSFQKPVSP